MSKHTASQALNKTTIVIADDHPLLRQALKQSLNQQPDFRVVAEAIDGEEVLRIAQELKPDIIIMDIAMPKINGLEATKRIKETNPLIAVLILTVYDDNEHIINTLQSGAAGYLTKTSSDMDVINAIRAITSGEMVFSREILQKTIINTFTRLKIPPTKISDSSLSSREERVLVLAAKGMPNKQIAIELNVSLRTIKGYWGNIFIKLGVSSRTEAIVKSLKIGLLQLNNLD